MVLPVVLLYPTTSILPTAMIVPTDGMPLAHSAALAVLSHFRTIRVPAGISGDLAWYLLHASRYMRWRLDIHIEGDWEMLLSATNSLAQTDRRFRIDTTDYPKYALLVYTNDIQNPTGIDLIDDEPPNTHEPPSQRHVDYCKVFFNCGLAGTHNFLFVQPDNVPLLPFQLLHRRMHGYTSPRIIKSPEERKARISHDVAAIECYLAKDPKREPWLICSLERRPFLQFLTDICTALPHAVPVVARYLALLPPGYALFSPTPQVPLFDAYLPLTKIPVAARRVPDHSSGWTVDFHEAKGQSNMRSALAQSQLLLSAILRSVDPYPCSRIRVLPQWPWRRTLVHPREFQAPSGLPYPLRCHAGQRGLRCGESAEAALQGGTPGEISQWRVCLCQEG
ncbi:hypothetical protein EDD18DRAFT_530608 [Armillaria luteobubalina]|uniref:Uncharacterized protein n=1 Tax=Armillaria luteobubalina TaxID=153913 RepID=A0AA39PYI4_9AGAR|nr:hypothetical protein EDD18DRAFT_530608 [Armillaria luteobubalina]